MTRKEIIDQLDKIKNMRTATAETKRACEEGMKMLAEDGAMKNKKVLQILTARCRTLSHGSMCESCDIKNVCKLVNS